MVHAPWYRSWWAYLLYALLLALIVWRYIAYRRDRVREQMQLQEHIHAEELSEAKLRFFMNFSHDIRTPMTLIVTPLLSLIKREGDPQKRGIYEIMRRNAERILGLINQMMDLRKIDKGQMQMHMRETDLIGFIQELYALFEHQARGRQIRFLYEHDAETLPIWIDRREDKLEQIFERFYQSDSKQSGQQTGTGIGLDLARSLVELHYGTISAHNLEQGCEFVIFLPLGSEHLKPDVETAEQLTLAEVEDSDDTAEDPIEAPTRQRPILVIAEDDEEIRDYLVQELCNDYEIKAFTDGRHAFAEIMRSVPDLVLSDVMMPDMDGNTLCMSLRSNLATSHVPVVMLTAMSMEEDRLRGLTTGADAYIVKPFNMDILRQTIINLIQRTRTLRLKYEHTDQLEGKTAPKSVKSPDEKLLANIMKAINDHLDDDSLTMDLIASEVGLSRVHLNRKMKDLTGQTPHDFIRKVRLKKAAELLASGKMNVSEVTYTCGFSSPTSFSALFKKFYGVSPSQYYKSKTK